MFQKVPNFVLIKNNQKYLEMVISDKAIQTIKSSNEIIALLMIAFNRGQNTIENWMISKDIRLTTPKAVQILKDKGKLAEHEILEEEPEEAQR